MVDCPLANRHARQQTNADLMSRLGSIGLALMTALAALAGADARADKRDERREDKREERHGRRDYKREDDVGQDEITGAVKRQEIRPLAEVAAAAEKAIPGQVVGVKVKRLSGKLVYEFKILTAQGRLREVYVDAATLEIVKIE